MKLSDYNCFYDVDEQDVAEGTDKAQLLINAIEKLIRQEKEL